MDGVGRDLLAPNFCRELVLAESDYTLSRWKSSCFLSKSDNKKMRTYDLDVSKKHSMSQDKKIK